MVDITATEATTEDFIMITTLLLLAALIAVPQQTQLTAEDFESTAAATLPDGWLNLNSSFLPVITAVVDVASDGDNGLVNIAPSLDYVLDMDFSTDGTPVATSFSFSIPEGGSIAVVPHAWLPGWGGVCVADSGQHGLQPRVWDSGVTPDWDSDVGGVSSAAIQPGTWYRMEVETSIVSGTTVDVLSIRFRTWELATGPHASWDVETQLEVPKRNISRLAFSSLNGGGYELDNVTCSTTEPFLPPVLGLGVAPVTSLASAGFVGGPFSPSGQTHTISNTGHSSLTWSAAVSGSWLHVTPLSGVLEAGSSESLLVSVDAPVAGQLPPDTYVGGVIISSSVGSSVTIGASLSITVEIEPGDTPLITAGPGWSGATAQPSQIGTGNASGFKPVAKLDVVPWQSFTGEFGFGVPAFHHRGIDRVEFSLDNGPWVSVTSMSLNPRTGVAEYWVRVDDGETDRLVEVRAVVYPVAGVPRVLAGGFLNAAPSGASPVTRYVSGSGSNSAGDGSAGSPWRSLAFAAQRMPGVNGGSAGGARIYAYAGDYALSPEGGSNISTPSSWLTIETAPGVDRSDVVITGTSSGSLKTENVHLRNITIRRLIYSRGGGGGGYWFDECDHVGNGQHTSLHPNGWLANSISYKYWTNGLVRENRYGPLYGFFRGMTITKIGEDVWRSAPFIVNCTVDDIDRGSNTSWHGDVIVQTSTSENMLRYGVRITNATAQGIFCKYDASGPYLKNHAFVNVLIEGRGGYTSQIDLRFDHLIMQNCTIIQTFNWRASNQNHHAIRDCIFSKMGVSASTDQGAFGSGSVADLLDTGFFSNNHYISTSGGVSPGSSASTGSITFVDAPGDDYHPAAGQGLNRGSNLVPLDAAGAVRSAPSTLGALQE